MFVIGVSEMKKKKITYEINNKSASEYGYLNFSKGDIEVEDFFPESEFKVKMEEKTIPNRKLDTERNRLNLYPLRDMFNMGDTIIIERKSEDLIKITKK